MKKQTVVVLGASAKPQRFAYKAIKLLIQYGHDVIAVHPALADIDGHPVLSDLQDIEQEVDTLTLYVGPNRSVALIEKIVALKPKRVILNPGTESRVLEASLNTNNIPFTKDCTLIMLNSNSFDL